MKNKQSKTLETQGVQSVYLVMGFLRNLFDSRDETLRAAPY
jgi:hypothetical protein